MASGLIKVTGKGTVSCGWEGLPLRQGEEAWDVLEEGQGGPCCSDALGNLRVRTRMGEDGRG
jgi:hypothetical protein